MISENRDILMERLEQKLVSREKEISELRKSLKDTILTELRDDMKDEVVVDKRISALEKKVKDMSLAYDGVMKELLDQKTVIQDLKSKYLKPDPLDGPDKPDTLAKWNKEMAEKEEEHVEEPPKPQPQYIIAESEDIQVPAKKKKEDNKNDIIIADHSRSRSSDNSEVIVESRDDEDVVLEYKK